MSREEPWLRGSVDGVIPELQPAAHALLLGRKRLPSNVRGLIYEIVVHTARHVGQIATTARIVS